MSAPQTTQEINARIRARGDYSRWLLRRYGGLDLIEFVDDPPPVSLRDVFVPLQLDEEDIDDDLGHDKPLADEGLPGRAAWECLIEHPFVAISGRPGSGKTTLVKALMVELCGERPSELRKGLVGKRGILPIPFILRDIPDLERIGSLDELMRCWLELELEEAAHKGVELDGERLRESFSSEGEAFPLLFLFDGIDEVGGAELRGRMLIFAAEAVGRGARVLVTGRPGGYSGLKKVFERLVSGLPVFTNGVPDTVTSVKGGAPSLSVLCGLVHSLWAGDAKGSMSKALNLAGEIAELFDRDHKLVLFHLQPLGGPQILRFIEAWYELRDEWRRQAEKGMGLFCEALEARPYLRTLARRPIFLTLMASVHVSRSRMPDGRTALYRDIVELYLIHQENHRRRRFTLDGEEMPHWPPEEPRLALGYLAWRSQLRAGESTAEEDDRRIVWERGEMEAELETLLGGDEYGDFYELRLEDADLLLDYYLHPAGLLVEPAEGKIQFAHLSFQEYLCAEYLLGRAGAAGLGGFLSFIEGELFVRLDRPGWDEVALLLLVLHAEQTQKRGHLELLGLLDPLDTNHARLMMLSYGGDELPWKATDRRAWLPWIVSTVLLNLELLNSEWAEMRSDLTGVGLVLLRELLNGFGEEMIHKTLMEPLLNAPPRGLTRDRIRRVADKGAERWAAMNEDDRAKRLLKFVGLCGWMSSEENAYIEPAECSGLRNELVGWVVRRQPDPAANGPFWKMKPTNPFSRDLSKGQLVMSNSALALDELVTGCGELWKVTAERIPLAYWLLEGESFGGRYRSSRVVMLSRVCNQDIPIRTKLSLVLYQALILAEMAGRARSWVNREVFRSWKMKDSSESLNEVGVGVTFRSRLRSLSRAVIMYLPVEKSVPGRLDPPVHMSISENGSRKLLQLLLAESSRYSKVRSCLETYLKSFPLQVECEDKLVLFRAIGNFGLQASARLWFEEQVTERAVAARCGSQSREPLPRAFGIFDECGIPFPCQTRAAWGQLLEWLRDDDAILKFVFSPGELSEHDEAMLRNDLKVLHNCSWAPERAVEGILAEWPEDEPERDMSDEAAEAELVAVLDRVLAEREKAEASE